MTDGQSVGVVADSPETTEAVAPGISGRARRVPGRGDRRGWLTLAILLAVVVGCGAAMFGPFERETIGVLAVLMMLGLIFLKAPVAAALAVPGLLGIWALRGFPAMRSGLTALPYDVTAQWTLSVVPMFVLMGYIAGAAGLLIDHVQILMAFLFGGGDAGIQQ